MSVYLPPAFAEARPELIHEIITKYSFATMVAAAGTELSISHLPFLFEPLVGPHGMLLGHMARANPQWRAFDGTRTVTVIFQGPHAYVSPRWYAPSPDNVPTWNYAVVHTRGVPQILDGKAEAYPVMRRLARTYDPTWPLELAAADRDELLANIVVFKLQLTHVEAKFKLSQNRSESDSRNVAKELSKSLDATARETGHLMVRVRR